MINYEVGDLVVRKESEGLFFHPAWNTNGIPRVFKATYLSRDKQDVCIFDIELCTDMGSWDAPRFEKWVPDTKITDFL